MKRSPFDEVYFVLFLITAWCASACIYAEDWVNLTFFVVPFVGWTLWRGGLQFTR